MKFYLCIDDTDNLNSIGTGTIAEQILKKIIEKGFGPCSLVTRHQLFIHPDIPYTSHNSSMCFMARPRITVLPQLSIWLPIIWIRLLPRDRTRAFVF